ncbi:hypothetical protein DENIS_0860 [Desulfonema ishimotonii]|uniref:Septum formation initiator n=2 Tax=Desulfonema ishimotonii TaxID=45657 RepID=A0A401FSI6_9BACT|nr:hypothetical protein DENIS_0860 [Desulfonema ishimotonii]
MNPKQNFVFLVSVAAMISMLMFIMFGDNGFSDLSMMKKGRDSLAQKNDALIQTNISLYRNIERLKDDLDYIESVARQELGVISKNEIIFKLAEHRQKGTEQ